MLHLMNKLFEVTSVVAVLLLQTCHRGGQPLVVGPSQTVIVNVGDDVILPCHLEPAVDAIDMTVEWARPELNPRFVHVWHERQDHLVNQHQSYKGRTSVSIESLKHGDISLKLSKVKLSDNGIYRCYIPDLNKDSTVELVVGAASSLVISLAGIDTSSSRVVLQCESKGWYPEPEVFWLDGERKLLSAGPTETVRGPDDLYTVISRVTVEKRHSNNFTCRVQQNHINQTRETHIIVPDEFFMIQSNSGVSINIRLAVSLTVCILLIFAVVFFVWRQNIMKKTRSCMDRIERGDSNETKMQVAEAAETESLMKTQRVSKNNKETKRFNDQQQLQQEQQRREEAENKVENMKQELENVKKELENMKKELENMKEENMKIKTQHAELQRLRSELETKKKELEERQNSHKGILKQLQQEQQRREEAENKVENVKLEESQNSQSFFSRNEPLEQAEEEVETPEKKLQTKQDEFDMKIKQ